MWTSFFDMHSGGGAKEEWERIYIEAPQEYAKRIFEHRFGHHPDDVTCNCCGNDYSIYSDEDLGRLTAYERGCKYIQDIEKKLPTRYIEDGEEVPFGFKLQSSIWKERDYISLEDYRKLDSVLFITKDDIVKIWEKEW